VSRSQELVFRNPQLESGNAGSDGAVYRFANVTNNVDALLKITGRSDRKVKLKEVDYTGSGYDKAFQPSVEYNNGNVAGTVNWWMEFEVSFVNRSSTNPANVKAFNLTALDIDGDGQALREYLNFYRVKSYTLDAQSLVTVSSVNDVLMNGEGVATGKKFFGPQQNFQGIDTAATRVMITVNYENASKFSFRIGGSQTGQVHSGAGDRMNSIWFKTFAYSAATLIMPVKLESFNAVLQNKQVLLNWATTEELNVSHFVIERSANGINYDEAAILFTEGNAQVLRNYQYKDALNGNTGILYYRLRIVDLDGKETFSPVRLVRIASVVKNQLELLTYPNPVASELRITIPETWQNKAVTYQLFDINGRLIKQTSDKNAGQTETINLQSISNGSYFLVAFTNEEKLSQRIIKN